MHAALDRHNAAHKSAGDDYQSAIAEARRGKPERLLNLLQARHPLAEQDFDSLAGLIEKLTRKPGGKPDTMLQRAADLALDLADLCRQYAGRKKLRDDEWRRIYDAAADECGIDAERIRKRIQEGHGRRATPRLSRNVIAAMLRLYFSLSKDLPH